MTTERQIIFHGHYFQDFYLEQTEKVREKIGYVFRVVKTVDKVPEKFLKLLEGTNRLYEIRIESALISFAFSAAWTKEI